MQRTATCLVMLLVSGTLSLNAQQIPDLQQLAAAKAAQGAEGVGVASALPARPAARPVTETKTDGADQRTAEKLDREIQELKKREKGPKRFAADLFDYRQPQTAATEGGIAEDYVLGTGDQLQINVFGSATFELPAQVDGRGEVVIPKVGSVKVGGLTLGKARQAVQAKVTQNFSRSTVDLGVTKLREVRVFVLGEVYKPGSYLVSSLSSLVNVLGLAGGPSAAGSYRQIRVLRGGKLVHQVDLYPLRAEGLGNMNFGFQNGDTLFVPMAFNQVQLEGGFARVVAQDRLTHALKLEKAEKDTESADEAKESSEIRRLRRTIKLLERQLNPLADATGGEPLRATQPLSGAATLPMAERITLEDRLAFLKDELKALLAKGRVDQRISEDEPQAETGMDGVPEWVTRWQQSGNAPLLNFEMLPGETAADALRFAGGLEAQAFSGRLSLRRIDPAGAVDILDVPLADGGKGTPLQKGDTLSALPRRDWAERTIELAGWVRVPGRFARAEGMRVADLLKREGQILPDTYLGRGEIVRRLPDGNTRYFAFDVSKALAGDTAHNLPLGDRDRVELYRLDDLRLRRTVMIQGPISRPGTYAFHEGMRASDLLFRAGIPLRQADRFVAELAHTRDGKPSQVVKLDLTKLLSNEQSSPVDLNDDVLNPKLEAFDHLSVYARPDYRPHRSITLSGQVRRPGVYTLDSDQTTVKELVERAGGLTSEAMPEASVFLRKMSDIDPEKAKAAERSGLEAQDPTNQGINEVLNRLAETKRQTTTGALLKNPLLHGLQTGALNRMVVNMKGLLAGNAGDQVRLQDGDEIIIPKATDAAYVVGETASPFATYKVRAGMRVKELVRMAGGYTRNADTWNVRLLKADGRILDTWVDRRKVEPGDTVLVPQRIRRDVSWQENLQALTPIAILVNTFK